MSSATPNENDRQEEGINIITANLGGAYKPFDRPEQNSLPTSRQERLAMVLKKNKIDIALLQEVHISFFGVGSQNVDKMEAPEHFPEFTAYFGKKGMNKKGHQTDKRLAILYRTNRVTLSILKTTANEDREMMVASLDKYCSFIINMYPKPNVSGKIMETANEYLLRHIEEMTISDEVVIGGDFNFIVRLKDQDPVKKLNQPFKKFFKGRSLEDVYPEMQHPIFTHLKKKRLDRIYVSRNLQRRVSNQATLKEIEISDHWPVMCRLGLQDQKKCAYCKDDLCTPCEHFEPENDVDTFYECVVQCILCFKWVHKKNKTCSTEMKCFNCEPSGIPVSEARARGGSRAITGGEDEDSSEAPGAEARGEPSSPRGATMDKDSKVKTSGSHEAPKFWQYCRSCGRHMDQTERQREMCSNCRRPVCTKCAKEAESKSTCAMESCGSVKELLEMSRKVTEICHLGSGQESSPEDEDELDNDYYKSRGARPKTGAQRKSSSGSS